MIRKCALTMGVAIAASGLVACSQKARDESSQAANTMAADTAATTAKAVNDIDAASDQAFGKAENSIDDFGNSVDNSSDRIDTNPN